MKLVSYTPSWSTWYIWQSAKTNAHNKLTAATPFTFGCFSLKVFLKSSLEHYGPNGRIFLNYVENPQSNFYLNCKKRIMSYRNTKKALGGLLGLLGSFLADPAFFDIGLLLFPTFLKKQRDRYHPSVLHPCHHCIHHWRYSLNVNRTQWTKIGTVSQYPCTKENTPYP